jgi:hypothetical protein
MSSALDMASFSIAVGKKDFLKTETWEKVFSPTISSNGDTLPYGYGWFIQKYKGLKIIWHYGFWNTNSSLIMMIPEREINFVILANTNLLSQPFGLGGPDGNIFHSPFAIEFAKTFLFDDHQIEINLDLPTDQLKKNILNTKNSDFEDLAILELFALASVYNIIGETEYSEKVFNLYSDLFAKPLPEKFNREHLITEINTIKNFANENKQFRLTEETEILIFAIGEGLGSDMYDYGWIESVATGDTLWEMTMELTSHAGGAKKNRQVDTSMILPAGTYELNYKSDDSHSFNQWNATPPEIAYYGIAIYK